MSTTTFGRPYRPLDTSERMRRFTDEQHAAFARLDAEHEGERSITDKYADDDAGVTYVDHREIVTAVYSVSADGDASVAS